MAVVDIAAIKNWFVTLSKPQQQHFFDWIDSFRHKNVKLTIDDFDTELQNLINSVIPNTELSKMLPVNLAAGVDQWTTPTDCIIEMFVVKSPTPISFRASTTGGGDNILADDEEDNVTDAENGNLFQVLKPLTSGQTIYFGGVQPYTTIKIYRR